MNKKKTNIVANQKNSNTSQKNSKARTSPAKFIRQVRSEVSKVAWPTRKETLLSTLMVFIMVVIMSLFFLLTDQVIAYLIRLILG